ncbi:MAG: cation:proton antiporter [Dehalococcoidales bacterium]|nr:cation:proton antiporter [Dehalococcoidales bacterium]
MIKEPLLAIGIMVPVGLLGGLLANKLKFPRITGYIIIGVLLSPSILNLVSKATLESWDIISTVVLAIIGYAIGGSLRMESIKKLGGGVAWLTLAETLGALAIVTLIVTLTGSLTLSIPNASPLHTYLPLALVIGAAVCPAAPAVTLAVIRELKARGPLTTTLLAVVALDDALGVILFAITLGIAKPLLGEAGGASLYGMLGIPALEILQSIGIGVALGFALIGMSRLVKSRALLMASVLGMLMLCVGLAETLGISVILACMAIGFVTRNRIGKNLEDEPFIVIESIEDFAFAIFFVLAGMHFDLSVIKVSGILAALIFAGRFSGKYLGIRASARKARAPDVVRKYLGFALLPEAGVTIGLALVAKDAFPELGSLLVNGILASVIINELIAPPMTKYAIIKAGEAEEVAKQAP